MTLKTKKKDGETYPDKNIPAPLAPPNYPKPECIALVEREGKEKRSKKKRKKRKKRRRETTISKTYSHLNYNLLPKA